MMIIDTPSMKKSIRAVLENNEENGLYDLNSTIRQARRIIQIYTQIAQSNPLKDNILLKKRDCIVLERKGTETIKMSVKKLFSDIEEAEEEMIPYLKWNDIQKIERIIRLLKSEKELQSKLSDISVTGMAFDDFERRILQFCQNLMDMDRIQETPTRRAVTTSEDVTTMSSNATTVTVDKSEYNALLAASHNSRNGGRNRATSPYQPRVEFQGRSQQSPYSRTDRSRSRDRGRERPSDRGSSRDRTYQQGLTPYSYRNTRDRSQERRRDYINDRRSR
jgi:hypothetical protein